MTDAPEQLWIAHPDTAQEYGRLISDASTIGQLGLPVTPYVPEVLLEAERARADRLEAALNDYRRDPYLAGIFQRAEQAADAARVKFPQPNYVTLKVAEEAGEVVRASVHYAEGRSTWQALEGEAVQAIAMIFRLLVEGDQVNGVVSPRAALGDEADT
jgi:hypothetical protein